jgi:outer membrane receptor protein involved in Fe transport
VNANLQYEFNAWGRSNYIRLKDDFASRQTAPTVSEDPGNVSYIPWEIKMPETNLLSLRLGTRVERLDISLFMNNVFNSHPALSTNNFGSTNDAINEIRTFRPRTLGITLSGSL